MYICVCRAITEDDVRLAVRNGARSVRDLRRDLQLGADCGVCGDAARRCLLAALHKTAAAPKKNGILAAA